MSNTTDPLVLHTSPGEGISSALSMMPNGHCLAAGPSDGAHVTRYSV